MSDSLSSPSRADSPFFSTLRHEAFRAIWIAAIFSYIGDWLQSVAQSWVMLSLTSSAVLVAMVTTCATIPAMALTLPSGVLADRFDRRRVLLFAQGLLVVITGALAVVTWLRLVTVAAILGTCVGLGVGSALSVPAWQTLVPELVPRREMPEAVTLNSVAFNIARALGPALAGLVLAAAGPAVAFALNSLSYIAVIEVLRRYPDVRRVSEKPRGGRVPESFARAMITAVTYAARSRPLRALYACIAVFSVAAASVPALLPLFAKEALRTNARGYGLLLGALGAGAILGAVMLRRARDAWRPHVLVSGAFALYGVSVLVASTTHSLAVATLALLPAGVGWLGSLSTLNALVQLSAPSWVRARAMALYQITFLFAWSIGATLGGEIAKRYGSSFTIGLSAAGTVLAAAITWFLPLPSYSDDADSDETRVSLPPPISGAAATAHEGAFGSQLNADG
jgi:MFS family permease